MWLPLLSNCLNKLKKIHLELPFNLWRYSYRHLSFSVSISMLSLSLLQPIVLHTFRLAIHLWHHVIISRQISQWNSFVIDPFSLKIHFTPYYILVTLSTAISYQVLWIQHHFSFKHSCHVNKGHVIQTSQVYKDLQTFTRSWASLLVGVRFNTLDVRLHSKLWVSRQLRGMTMLDGISTARFHTSSMKLHICKNCIIVHPVNILMVWYASFLGRTTVLIKKLLVPCWHWACT